MVHRHLTLTLPLIISALIATLPALTAADQILIGYWYHDRPCDSSKAAGMYVDAVGGTYAIPDGDGAGAVYLLRAGVLHETTDCSGGNKNTQVKTCEAFQTPKRIHCVKNTA